MTHTRNELAPFALAARRNCACSISKSAALPVRPTCAASGTDRRRLANRSPAAPASGSPGNGTRRTRTASSHVASGANASSGDAEAPTSPRSIHLRLRPSHGPAAAMAAMTPRTAPSATERKASSLVGPSAEVTRAIAGVPGRRIDSPRSSVKSPRTKRTYWAAIGSSV